MKYRVITAWLLVFFLQTAFAQKTVYQDALHNDYRTALDLFAKEKYGAAKKKFTDVEKNAGNTDAELKSNAQYHAAICAVKLFNNDAGYLLDAFIAENPEHARINHAYFYQASYYYAKKSYSKALRAFQMVDKRNLGSEELAEYYFKTGYCYFIKEDFESAAKAFFEIKDADTKYKVPANYYYGHIAYRNNNMETAMKSFQLIKDDVNFGPLVPYYIVHIYYKQERYKELLEQATSLMDKTGEDKAPELARIIGEAYYKSLKFAEAITYLELYASKTKLPLTKEDNYQLGYCYYRAGQHEKAIEKLTLISTEKDSLAQNAHYMLADCYLKTNQLQYARNAFQSAYKLDFDKTITQSALLNYAKLSYQLSFNPYNDAVVALMTYIDTYPDAHDIDEANNLLVNVFYATKNYKAALTSIENIKFKTTELKSAYQKIALYRGMELFNNRDFTGAITHFNKSADYVLHPQEAALALYWKGESFYRLNRFDSATRCFNEFLLSQGAFGLPEFTTAQYNLGYSLFKQKQYTGAITAFRKFIGAPGNADKKFIHDAHIRTGDAYYVTKNYNQAIDFYNPPIMASATDADYALYQKAVCYGVLAQFNAKIDALLDLLKRHPSSGYIADAKFELGNTYLIMPDYPNALKYFGSIVNEHPSSSYVVQALLKTGLIYFNTGEDEKALQTLKKVVADYPGTTASKDALVSIRDIYVNMQKTEEFFVYVKNIPFANVTESEQDSITYIATQNQYMSGDCNNSVKGFTDYLDKFPEGAFVVNARFYRAECLFRQEKLKEALKDYNDVLRIHRTRFTESALVKAAAINFKLKNYNEALTHYVNLEDVAEIRTNVADAQIGQMRCYMLTANYRKAIEAAAKIVNQDKIDNNIIQEAQLITGKSHFELKEISFAQASFLAVTRMGENEMKAEAKYYLALIQYDMANYKESEKIIFEIINQMPSYNYWIARSFILLADNLVKMDNVFQAKHTLQSIIDNYEGLDLVQIAFEKLNKINEDEKLKSIQQAPLDTNILEINY